MNLVFIGSSKFGLRCLAACVGMPDLNVTGVVTSPQIFPTSYRHSGETNVLYPDVVGLTSLHAIPVQTLLLSMNGPGLFGKVEAWKPDIFLVAGWCHMIPKQLHSPIEKKRPHGCLLHGLDCHQ